MSLIIKKQDISKVKEFTDVKWANVTSIFALIFVFAKTVLVPKKILGSFLLILIFIFGSLPMVPYYYAYGATINLSLFLISSFIYGSIFYSFRRSTLFDNIKETNLSKTDIYFSIFIVMFLFTAIDYLFIISFFIIGLAMDSSLFMDDWFFRDYGYGAGGYAISELNAQLMFWWFFAFILLNFSLFYLFQNIASSQKTFYLFVFVYLVLLMLYGNSINTPYISAGGNTFVIGEKYPFLTENSENNIHNYITGIAYKRILLNSNIGLFLDDSFYINGVSGLLKAKFEQGNYFSAIMTLLTPHFWINLYSANVMKSTCLSIENFDPQTIDNKTTDIFWNEYPKIHNNINDFSTEDNPKSYVYSEYHLKNAKIWSLKNEISWILGMYLWMAYFIFFYLIGRCVSKFIYYKN